MDKFKKLPSLIPIGISILALILSAIFGLWTLHIDTQLRQLESANVIVRQDDITITRLNSGCGIENKGCDRIVIGTQNVGRAAAEEVKIVFYTCAFDEDLQFASTFGCSKNFDSTYITNLSPGETGRFGRDDLTHYFPNAGSMVGKPILILVAVSFKDSLTKNTIPLRLFAFQYALGFPKDFEGENALVHLISDDYDSKCLKLKENLTDAGATMDIIEKLPSCE